MATNATTAFESSTPGFTAAAWNGIPYEKHFKGSSSTATRTKKDLYDMRTDSFAINKGDICYYIGVVTPTLAGYRMPTPNELYYDETSTYDWRTVTDKSWKRNPAGSSGWSAATGNASGTYPITWGGKVFDIPFPASGRREYGGSLGNVGTYGSYWSGAGQSNITVAQKLKFDTDDVTPDTYDSRYLGFPVRCVKGD
jgi:hypothetical protein